MAMYWWGGVGSWRRTITLWAWNGSSWSPVLDCWIWDGSAWQHIYSSTFGTPVTVYIDPDMVSVPRGTLQIFNLIGVDSLGAESALSSVSWSIVSGLGAMNPTNGHFTADPSTTGTTTIKAHHNPTGMETTATVFTV